MKLTLERDLLHAALGRVAKIVERKSTIPILTNLRLRAAAGALHLTGTDLGIEAQTNVPADVAEPGETTLEADRLADIVGKLPAGAQLQIEAAGKGQALLRAGRARFTLNSLPAEDFPDFSVNAFSHEFEVAAKTLDELLGKVEFSISNEETRYYLNGVYLHCLEVEGHSMLRAVATDGHRLARMDAPAPNGTQNMPGIIIPRKTVAELRRLIKNATAPVKISLDANRIRAAIESKTGATILTSKLIDGTFPDYIRIMPTGNDKRATIDSDAMKSALARVACISSESGRSAKFSFADDKLIISVTNPDVGEAVEEIEVGYEERPVDIGFNAKYVAEILSAIDADNVLIKLADQGSPTLFAPREGAPLLIVLMPMRI